VYEKSLSAEQFYTPRQTVYRLDTAVMLSHVFLDGAPDQARERHYVERTKSLCRALARG
jgi:hypothetical protein